MQAVFEAVLGELPNVLIQEQPDNGGRIKRDLPEFTVVYELIDGNVEGDDTGNVSVYRTEFLTAP